MGERQRWMAVLAKPYGDKLPTNYFLWDWLHRVCDCAAPDSVITAVLQAGLLENIPNLETFGPTWMELVAALCPTSQREALRTYLFRFDALLTANASALLEILDGMENDHTNG